MARKRKRLRTPEERAAWARYEAESEARLKRLYELAGGAAEREHKARAEQQRSAG
jgi:hypothetical protein